MSRILIIEDEEAIAEIEKDYLELSDFEVVIEGHGEKGLKKALSEDFDLVLLDVMLPGKDGCEICKEIRNEKILIAICYHYYCGCNAVTLVFFADCFSR